MKRRFGSSSTQNGCDSPTDASRYSGTAAAAGAPQACLKRRTRSASFRAGGTTVRSASSVAWGEMVPGAVRPLAAVGSVAPAADGPAGVPAVVDRGLAGGAAVAMAAGAAVG